MLWKTLYRYYFRGLIASSATVLELGEPFDFINSVDARRRIAVVTETVSLQPLPAGIEIHVGPVTDLSFLDHASVDVAFASRVLARLARTDCDALIRELKRVLRPRARVIFVPPLQSDVSFSDLLVAHGFTVRRRLARFLPPVVRSWLRTLIVAENRTPRPTEPV